MDEEELKNEICEYVHNLHKAEPFNGFTYRDLRDVAEHFALPREKRIAELEIQNKKMRCCSNCKYWFCTASSISIDENENRTVHNWNKEKQVYCDVSKNGKYQCWELAE